MYKNILFCIFLLAGFSSCKKLLDEEAPKNRVTDAVLFDNAQTATGTLTQVYGLMNQLGAMSGTTLGSNLGFTADEMIYSSSGSFYDTYINNTYTSATNLQDWWGTAYQFIYIANTAVGRLPGSPLPTATRNQLLGEAYFIRAWSYFYLVNLYGDVPLVLSTDYNETSSIPRTPKDEVYTQMIADLQSAVQFLQPSYPTADKARPNKYAATALLARVYLYAGQWVNAETAATDIIASGLYTPLPTASTAFLKASKETIWQLYPVNAYLPDINTFEAFYFIPFFSFITPTYQLRANLVDSFETGDARKTSWVGTSIIGGKNYYYPAKYKLRSSTTIQEMSVVLRAGEVYLIRAEARAQQNNLVGAVADINVIRGRAGLPATAAATQTAMLDAIYRERKFELFSEWGHRWFDLKRTGKVNSVLGALKPTWTSKAALFPLSDNVRLYNPLLIQNPGY